MLDHPVIAVQGERPLEHDRRAAHKPAFQRLICLVPEIHIDCRKRAAAVRAGFPRQNLRHPCNRSPGRQKRGRQSSPVVGGWSTPRIRCIVRSCPAPLLPMIPRISPSLISNETFLRACVPSKSIQMLSTVISWSLHNSLIPNVVLVSYYLLYHARCRHDRKFTGF